MIGRIDKIVTGLGPAASRGGSLGFCGRIGS